MPRFPLPELLRPALQATGSVRPFVVYGFVEAVAALRTAREQGVPALLFCPPAVLGGLGPEAVVEMIAQAQADVRPSYPVQWVCDCGSDAGLALAAIRAGIPSLVVHVKEPARSRLMDIGRQAGVEILDHVPVTPLDEQCAGQAGAATLQSGALPTPDG